MNIYIFILALVGFTSSMILIYQNKKKPGYCPYFMNIPACFIVALAYVFVCISVVLELTWMNELFFWAGCVLGLFMAVWFSYQKFVGKKECPKFVGVPLCFVSLVVFVALIAMKFF